MMLRTLIHCRSIHSDEAIRERKATIPAMLLLLISILALPAPASAQRVDDAARIIFGIATGYEFGIPLVLNRAEDAPFICDCEGTGVSYNHTISAGVEMIVPGLLGSDIGAAARLTTGFSTGRFTSDPYATQDTGAAPPQNRFIVDVGSTQLEAQLLGTFRFGSWGIGLGPALSYRIGGVFTQREQIVSPADSLFPSTGTSERVVASGENLAGPRLATSGVMRLSYTFPLSAGMELRHDLQVRVDAEGITGGAGLGSLSVGAGLTLFFGGDESSKRIDTVILPGAPAQEFTASLDIYGYDGAGRRMERLMLLRRALHQRQYTSLPRVIYFEKGSSMIPTRYTRYTAGETRAFTLDSLAGGDVRSVYYQLLNIIGMRLHADRAATISLVGFSSIDEPEQLANARAEEVRRYLTESWGIAAERIAISRARERRGYPGDRMVEVVQGAPGVTNAVQTEWVMRQLDAPAIEIEPQFNGGRGMKRWDISIRQAGREVARYSSDGSQGDRALDAEIIAGSGAAEPLVAEIIAEDSAGALAAARDRLPLEVEDAPGGERITTYIVTASDAMTPGNILSQSMMAWAREGKQVTIIYPNDTASLAGAERLAGTFRSLMQGGDGTVELRRADAIDEGRTRADLPEDRHFRRQLTVIIQGEMDSEGN